MRALNEAKAAGVVRAVGVSCHSFPALGAAAREPWVEILLARINYRGDNMDASPERVAPVLRRAYESQMGVLGMKVYGCGTLVHDLERAVKWVFGLGTVHAITIGPTDNDHIERNVRLIKRFTTTSTTLDR